MNEINTYIQEQRNKGLSDEQIKKSLLDNGWAEADINVALNPQAVPEPKLASPRELNFYRIIYFCDRSHNFVTSSLFLWL